LVKGVAADNGYGDPWPAAYRLADRWLKEWLPRVTFREVHIASDLVGDTGIEPVTSSV
jgi:hypothetical protein